MTHATWLVVEWADRSTLAIPQGAEGDYVDDDDDPMLAAALALSRGEDVDAVGFGRGGGVGSLPPRDDMGTGSALDAARAQMLNSLGVNPNSLGINGMPAAFGGRGGGRGRFGGMHGGMPFGGFEDMMDVEPRARPFAGLWRRKLQVGSRRDLGGIGGI